ncbi:MAG: response regulator [Deltaproteobacteria bacterium]
MSDKILLVDDDKDFRTEMRYFLEDYEVTEASNGTEALNILKRPNEIDLVILDVVMPGLNGTDVLKEVRKIAPEVGIIILTGFSSKTVAIDALKGRADDYLEKPIDPERTKEIIETLLARKRGEPEITASDIEGKIERVKKFTERNGDKKVCLKDAAVAVCLSPKYLSRIFKQSTGTGFSEYKLQLKIKRAKELLETTGYNIDQISDKLGYQNAESFIRIFKKMIDLTPTEYRKRFKEKSRAQKTTARSSARSSNGKRTNGGKRR